MEQCHSLLGLDCNCLTLQENVKHSHINNQKIHFRACISKVEGLLGNRIKGWRELGLDWKEGKNKEIFFWKTVTF